MSIDLIILAAIAVFVISRLYAVLGQKTGAEPPARRLREAPVRAPDREDDASAEPADKKRLRAAFTGPLTDAEWTDVQHEIEATLHVPARLLAGEVPPKGSRPFALERTGAVLGGLTTRGQRERGSSGGEPDCSDP